MTQPAESESGTFTIGAISPETANTARVGVDLPLPGRRATRFCLRWVVPVRVEDRGWGTRGLGLAPAPVFPQCFQQCGTER